MSRLSPHASGLSVRHVGVATYPPGATFGPRRLLDWEFVWLLEGDARYLRSAHGVEDEIRAPQGTLVLCRPCDEDETDAFVWDAKKRTRHAFFHFALEFSPTDWPALQSWPTVRQISPGDLRLALFRHVLTRSDDLMERDLSALLLLRAFVTGEDAAREPPPDTPPLPVERALSFLYARLDEDASTSISLPALARAACVSPEHLCRAFKSSTGHTPLETVRLARLDRAATLLARSNFNVAEVSRLCGFASPFHFSRAFRSAFGYAPRELRARLARGEPAPVPTLLRTWRE